MSFTADQLLEKFNKKWSDRYGKTAIRRTRRGDGRGLRPALAKLLADVRLHRKCIICCSFLSKRALVRELNRVERGERVPGHILQLIWILSSFAHAIRDGGAAPIVYCAP